jgi:hypothetical protein
MGIRSGAQPVLVEQYATREYRRNLFGTLYYRDDQYLEYELPWYDAIVETQEVLTPSGYTYKGCRNRVTKKIPLMGTHTETFVKSGSTWTAVS